MTDRIVLNGKWSLVTGASSGLGVSLAHRLAQRGSNLILVARREDRLKQVCQELLARYPGIAVDVIALDLGQPDAAQRLYDQVKAAGREIEVLVNNAGFGLHGAFVDIPWEKEHEMLELNMVTLTHLTKLLARDMVARHSGRIMQVASTGGYAASPHYATYAATKNYVVRFGEAFNYELRGTGVRCTVLSPGAMLTEFQQTTGHLNWFLRWTQMDADKVAEAGVKAMINGRTDVVPGWFNWVLIHSAQAMPRRVSLAVADWIMR
ncbi:MAG: SDR family oxidoreductase [Chloroflexi bacterium]|nr:SDR family oxidoreductase [Chloroflexota bacterium]